MQIVDQELPASLKKLEEVSEIWPSYIRLVAALIQRSLAEFISPLLMVGLIMSMANFLLDGVIFRNPAIPIIWAIVQCVAIDANLGIMIVRSVKEFHASEWIKGIIYLAISFALLFVAAIIFDVEAVQTVVNHTVGVIIPIEVLTIIRSAAVVALVATTGLEGVSLRRQKSPSSSTNRETQGSATPETSENLDRKKLEMVGSETSGNLLAIKPEQWQRLSEAYERLEQQGYIVSRNKLREESGVRSEIVGPWLKWRQSQLQQEEVSVNGNGHQAVPS